jgi:hypothetical protein
MVKIINTNLPKEFNEKIIIELAGSHLWRIATDEEKEELRKEKKSITSLNSIVSIDDLVEEVRNKCCDKIQHLYSKIKLLISFIFIEF